MHSTVSNKHKAPGGRLRKATYVFGEVGWVVRLLYLAVCLEIRVDAEHEALQNSVDHGAAANKDGQPQVDRPAQRSSAVSTHTAR